MDETRFDSVTKLFADRRLSRRRALAKGGAGLAAAGLAAAGLKAAADAQNATPAAPAGQVATPAAGDAGAASPATMFLQSFQRGSLAPKAGADATYTLNLESGLGQTVWFTDRPARNVGALPTAQFLDAIGFPPDNPPNAALVAQMAPGDTDIAVITLFDPRYEVATANLTYDVQVLKAWHRGENVGFAEAATDLSQFAASFTSTHLFIDDCPDGDIYCHHLGSTVDVGGWRGVGYCWAWGKAACVPCNPGTGYDSQYIEQYWADQCNATYPDACQGTCHPTGKWFG